MRRTLVFLLTEDWFFASHFWVRALAAKRAGWRVILVARESEATARIRESGIEVVPVDFIRRRLNPFAELGFTLKLARLYREIKPDLVHHIALKPIVLGGIAAKLAGTRAIVNAPVGLGFVFSSDRLLARVLRPLVAFGLRLTLTPRHSIAVFENPDDMDALVKGGMARGEAVTLIRGAGVDIEKFHPTPEPSGPVRISADAVQRAIDDDGHTIRARTTLGPDGKPAGARLTGVSGAGLGLLDGDVIVAVDGARTMTDDDATDAALRAVARGDSRLHAILTRDGQPFEVVLDLPLAPADAGK